MSALVRSEALKLLATRRTLLAFALALLALGGLAAASTVDSSFEDPSVAVSDTLRDVISSAAAGAIFIALILGILVVTWEYQHRTMTHTLLAAPLRERVVGAKTAVAGALGLVLGAIAVVIALAVALPWLGGEAASELGVAAVWGRVGRVVLGAALWGCLGVLVGALVASQVAAIVSTLLWALVVEPVLGGLVGIEKYLPGGAMQALVGTDGDFLPPAAGFGLTLGYVALFAALAVLATLGRDIT